MTRWLDDPIHTCMYRMVIIIVIIIIIQYLVQFYKFYKTNSEIWQGREDCRDLELVLLADSPFFSIYGIKSEILV